MLNSYEIAEKMKSKLHIKVTYNLEDVYYNPCYSVHRIYIEDLKGERYVFDIDDTTIQRNIESLGLNKAIALLEDDINNELRDVELDSLVEYYFKKGMHMAEINKILMTGGLTR